MKEFIDKLIERLEEEKGNQEYLLGNARDNIDQKCIHKYASQCYELAISIINELAEEYKGNYESVGVLKQIMWERDIAIEQLHELGYEFGEKIAEEYKVSEMPTGSEDCCEWRKGTSGVFPIKTSCGNSVDVNYGYEFCPYCGKKIKVAPYTEGE